MGAFLKSLEQSILEKKISRNCFRMEMLREKYCQGSILATNYYGLNNYVNNMYILQISVFSHTMEVVMLQENA